MRFIARSIFLFALLALLASACASDGTEETSEPAAVPTAEATPEPTEAPEPPDEPEGSLAAAEDEPEDTGPVAGGVLRVGLSGITSPDPAKASPGSQSELVLADLLFDGLTEWDPAAAELRPALARSWELADDLLSWEFLIDEDAQFSDGAAVTAADVKASLEHVVAVDPLGPAATRLEVVEGYGEFVAEADGISGIVAVDDGTVRFELAAPFSQLPEILASPVFGITAGTATDVSDLATSGSFEVAAADDNAVSLAAIAGEELLLDGIDVHLFEDREAAAAALKLGDVDWSVVSRETAAELDLEAFQAQLNYEMMVTQGVLSNASLRRAIVSAVDTAAIAADVYPGTAAASSGLVPGSGACAEGNSACGYSPERAADLIAEAFVDGDVPTVHVDYYEEETGREQAVAEAIAADLVAAGIPAEARAHSFEDFAVALASGDLELFRSGWLGVYPSPEAWLGRYHSESLDNLGYLVSPETDAALEAARSADRAADAAAAYADAEAAILGSAPVLPLLQFAALSASSDVVQDLAQRLDGTFDVSTVWVTP